MKYYDIHNSNGNFPIALADIIGNHTYLLAYACACRRVCWPVTVCVCMSVSECVSQ